MHNSRDLITLFDRCFGQTFNTVLVGGGAEPVYLPSLHPNDSHKIVFTRDYYASAMHEISHWLIAGAERRMLEDYGYWYAPDGRNAEQQTEFERVEVKPQALEWVLSRAAGCRFRLSSDNLQGGGGASEAFARAVVDQARTYCQRGVNARARGFIDVLNQFYQTEDPLQAPLYEEHFL